MLRNVARNRTAIDWFWLLGWPIHEGAACTRIALLCDSTFTVIALSLIQRSQAKRQKSYCRHEHLNLACMKHRAANPVYCGFKFCLAELSITTCLCMRECVFCFLLKLFFLKKTQNLGNDTFMTNRRTKGYAMTTESRRRTSPPCSPLKNLG